MLIHDGATALSRERTPEGFLRVRARIGRAGLHDYKAGEIGGPPGVAPDRTVKVYRPPEDVFDADSLASFAQKPVTLDHPPRMVDSANWKSVAVGHSSEAVTRDGEHVATDLVITDAAAVARAEAGAELSNGYWADFVFAPGTTPDGQAYDAVQRNIRGNHIALVDAGRCGPTCRVDAVPPAVSPCGCGAADHRSVTIEGVAVTTDAAGAAALATLQGTLDDARAERTRALEVRDGEVAALRASIAAANPDPARLDALVVERARVLDAAQRLIGAGFDGRTLGTAAVRRAVVDRLLGPQPSPARSDDYIAAAFDALAAARGPANPLAFHVAAGLAGGSTSREAALAARNRYLTDAWKGHIATGAA